MAAIHAHVALYSVLNLLYSAYITYKVRSRNFLFDVTS